MSGVRDDLATLREELNACESAREQPWVAHTALARVEAEIAQLEQRIDVLEIMDMTATANRPAVPAPGEETAYGHRGIRLTLAEIDDLCYRHCELEEPLTAEEIDRLIDTAAAAHAIASELDRRVRGEDRDA